MGAAFLITLREGLEAALIVAIVLAYLRQIGRRDRFPAVFAGSAAAVVLSLIAGTGIYFAIGGLEGDSERIAFALVSLSAVGVLTWMIFWMRRQAGSIGQALRQEIDRALAAGTVGALASVVFFGVLREGLETVLFLLAVVVGSSAFDLAVGAGIGLGAAAALGYVLYQGGRRLNLRLFFQLTGGLVILVAAGLFSRGVAWLQEAGLFGTYLWPLWNVQDNAAVGHGVLAEFLNGLFGWNPRPSVEEFAFWLAYLVPVGWLFYFGLPSFALGSRMRARPPAEAPRAALPAAGRSVRAASLGTMAQLLAGAGLAALAALGFFVMTSATDARPEETVSLGEEREERLLTGGVEGDLTDATPLASVTVALHEWGLKPDPDAVPTGPIRFIARNVGAVDHELVILKTDLPPEELPVDARIEMAETPGKIIGEMEAIEPEATRQATFQLDAGRYVLLCNLPEHYQQGMFAAFLVR